MDIASLVDRLKKAHATKSLRKLGEICGGLSHEQIRKLILTKSPSMTVNTFTKIEKGLSDNGF